MPYIGTSPSNGVRQTYDYTATAGQTSFSGSDNNSQTLTYTDSAYIDVYQNGILLIPSDYTATTGTTVVLDTGATVSDTLQIVVYDVFSVADTVSASDGGSFGGNLGVGGTLSVTGIGTFSDDIIIGDGKTIGSTSDVDAMTISSGGVVTFSQTPSGTGWDLIYDATVSNAAQYDVDCTSTYDNYYIVFNLVPATDDAQLRFYQVVGGSEVTDNHLAYAQSQIDSASHGTLNASAHGNITVSNVGSDVGEDAGGWILLSNVNSTALPWKLFGGVNYATTDATHLAATFTGMQLPAQRANVLDKLRLEFSTGNVESGYVKVFGIK